MSTRRPPQARPAPRRLAVIAALVALLPAGAGAHPHIFIDGGVDFVFDAEGRLDGLRVTWIYDPLTSLFMLEDLGIPFDAPDPLPPADRAGLAAYQTEWIEGFDGDSYLHHGGARISLSEPLDADAAVRGGQVVISFLRRVETPVRPDASTEVQVYDPTYFTAYAVTDTPRFEGGADGCRAEVIPFRPSAMLEALQEQLMMLPADADPEGEPGALFAERIRVTCD